MLAAGATVACSRDFIYLHCCLRRRYFWRVTRRTQGRAANHDCTEYATQHAQNAAHHLLSTTTPRYGHQPKHLPECCWSQAERQHAFATPDA